MALSDLDIRISYTSQGESDILDDFLVPALKEANLYKRSVGFFSSSVFELLGVGLQKLIDNNGQIKIICSPELSREDLEGIQLGYALKAATTNKLFEDDIDKTISELSDENLIRMVTLISTDHMNVIVVDLENSRGIYHDKIGIIQDKEGNKILFVGSPNESVNAYEYNYEKVRVSVSWNPYDIARIDDDEQEFDGIWNGTNKYIRKKDYTYIMIDKLKEEAKKRNIKLPEKGKRQEPIQLRDYQEKAIENWIANDFHGFYVMATGTGKTWTAIYSALEVIKNRPILLVICAPYKHLVRQWYEDIHKVLPNNATVMISGENHEWEDQLLDAILNVKYGEKVTIVAISTIKSFNKNKFSRIADKATLEKMLIVDEAHRFKNLNEEIKDTYRYMLGLSATPFSHKQDKFGQELMDYFGGQVFDLPLEYAIEHDYLVHYNYYPIYVNALEEEERNFERYTSLMASCFRNNICINVEKLAKYKRARLRVISMAHEKLDRINWILGQIREDDHFIVYCGDGRLFEEERGEEVRHIQYVKDVLSNLGYRVNQFTAEENIKDRMQIVNSFNKGMVDSLVAIRCLDEGINIPSIKGALILSSNDDYREFIQRRGRILRTYTNEYTGEKKEIANIYDVIVLPPTNKIFAQIELRRFYEYARLADNADYCIRELADMMAQYNLTMEDIVDLEENEDDLDE
ncbi:MAG: DEAD/DEAH box helicase family protein [Lachnospiraceae bacterium]|nr:DEAD/DEAH box helicase family protein [Lachnospiraceae bacterium]